MTTPWSAATGTAIGADWLFAQIAPASVFGRRVHSGERAFRRGDEPRARAYLEGVDVLAQSYPAHALSTLCSALASAPDVTALVARARAGDVLGDDDFFELGRFVDVLAELRPSLHDDRFVLYDDRFVDAQLWAACERLCAALAPGRSHAPAFYLADDFDPVLARAREQSAHAQEVYDTARGQLAQRVARALGSDDLREGEFTLPQGGALPPGVRVLREGATYRLCELVLDDATRDALGRRDAAAAAVGEAEENVRVRLSACVATEAAALEALGTALGEFDVFVARAQFAQRYACVVPEIVDEARIVLDDARFLPLMAELELRGRAYIPVSLDVEGVGIVTGPNMGGKTVALRTLGFFAACVALGVPVPARTARVPLVDEIVWLGVGAQHEESTLLSAFGAEVVELRGFLGRAPGRPLVLVDEVARTTSPREGRAMLVALLARLRRGNAFGLAATHFSGVAVAAGVPHFRSAVLRSLPAAQGALSLDAALARIAAAMDYRFHRVAEAVDISADAFALAEALGLDPALIEAAHAALALPAN